MATDDEVRAFSNVRDKLAETQADLRAWVARAERAEAERDLMRPVVEAAREVAHAWREAAGLFAQATPEFKGFLAAAEAYETLHLRLLIAQQFDAAVDTYEKHSGEHP